MGAEGVRDGVTTAATPAGYINRDELVSLRVVSEAKRIFLALCENSRGRYLKISDGRNKLIVPGPGVDELRAAVDALQRAAANPAIANGSAVASPASPLPAEPLHAERFISEGRKFYLDLMENARGRYLKISQATTRRVSVIFPAAGLPLLREALDRLHELAPPDVQVTSPASVQRIIRTVDRKTPVHGGATVVVKAVQRELRVDGKRIVFESGANHRGSYLRITESHGGMKNSVTLPHSSLPSIVDLLREVQEAGDPAEDLRAAENAAGAAAQEAVANALE